MLTEPAPVLRPTAAEFRDFAGYIDSVYERVAQTGIARIVPPRGWAPGAPEDADPMVRRPVLQCLAGTRGVYTVHYTGAPERRLSDFRDASLAIDAQSGVDPADPAAAERQFWRGLSAHMAPPTYGADLPGSQFAADAGGAWNLHRLDTLLSLIGDDMPGVTRSMLYVGQWRAMFSLHKEDLDLFSINYLHRGAPKFWYGVPPGEAWRVDELAKVLYPEDHQRCPEFLRHKNYLLAPQVLQAKGIPVFHAVHAPGEFVITLPATYHWGFNLGYNVAEAVNFATWKWLPVGRRAGVCRCRPDCVRIDMPRLLNMLERVPEGGRPAEGWAAAGHRFRAEDGADEDLDLAMAADPMGWVFACAGCGQFCTSTSPPLFMSHGAQYECSGCGVWCHVDCQYPGRLSSSSGSSSSGGGAVSTAEMQAQLAAMSSGRSSGGSLGGSSGGSSAAREPGEEPQPQPEPEQPEQPRTASGRVHKPSARVLQRDDDEPAGKGTSKPKRRRKKKQLALDDLVMDDLRMQDEQLFCGGADAGCLNGGRRPRNVARRVRQAALCRQRVVQRRAHVVVQYGLTREPRVGVVVQQEDASARVHVLGTARGDDVWVDVDSPVIQAVLPKAWRPEKRAGKPAVGKPAVGKPGAAAGTPGAAAAGEPGAAAAAAGQ